MFFRIVVPADHIGTLVEHGAVTRTFGPGIHWGAFSGRLYLHTAHGRFTPPADVSLDTALATPELADELEVAQVPEGARGIVYRDEVFEEVVGAGKVAFFRSPKVNYRVELVDTTAVYVPPDIAKLALRHYEVAAFVRSLHVRTGYSGLLLVNGEVFAQVEAGTKWVFENGNTYELKLVPKSIDSLEVNGQEMLTADKATVRVNFYVRYRVADLQRALLEVIDYAKELRLAAAIALREYVGGLRLDELLASKLDAGAALVAGLGDVRATLGVELVDAGLRDIVLPGDMRAIYNRVLEAEKTAEANAIVRRDEAAATRTKLNAAKLMDEHPTLRRLTELDYVERIAERVDKISVAGGSGGGLLEGLREVLVAE